MLLSCSVSHSDVCAIGRFTFQPVTLSRGTGPFWDFTSGCHRIDKKDKKTRWTNQDSIRQIVFQVCLCVCGGNPATDGQKQVRARPTFEFCEQRAHGHWVARANEDPSKLLCKCACSWCGVRKNDRKWQGGQAKNNPERLQYIS